MLSRTHLFSLESTPANHQMNRNVCMCNVLYAPYVNGAIGQGDTFEFLLTLCFYLDFSATPLRSLFLNSFYLCTSWTPFRSTLYMYSIIGSNLHKSTTNSFESANISIWYHSDNETIRKRELWYRHTCEIDWTIDMTNRLHNTTTTLECQKSKKAAQK